MTEPIVRRKILVDYRIKATKCEGCGKVYFPPKLFCDKEGRKSKMQEMDFFYEKGRFFSGTVIRSATTKFNNLSPYLSGIIHFPNRNINVPARITDYVPPPEEVDISEFINREVVPRFRRIYADGKSGLISYSSLNFSFENDYYPFQKYEIIKPSSSGNDKPGIIGYGVYLPKFRIKNESPEVLGVIERTVPFADEDATTFSVEAGKRALIHSAIESRKIKKCFVGSESTPYAVNPSMSTVVQVLELGEKYKDGFFCAGIDSQFACKAASDLFIDAVALVNYPAFNGEYVMVIGADDSQAAPNDPLDYTVGAGGAAFIFGRQDVIATLDYYVSYTSDTPDFYRREGEIYPKHGGRFTGIPAYFKHIRTALNAILKASGLCPSDIQYFVTHCPNFKFPNQVALEAGFNKEQIEAGLVVRWIGNLYSASSLTGLAAVLDIAKAGDRILLTSYGSGAGSDAYIFTVTEEIDRKRERLITVKKQIESAYGQYVDYSTYRKWKEK